jgi:hypothetical protein
MHHHAACAHARRLDSPSFGDRDVNSWLMRLFGCAKDEPLAGCLQPLSPIVRRRRARTNFDTKISVMDFLRLPARLFEVWRRGSYRDTGEATITGTVQPSPSESPTHHTNGTMSFRHPTATNDSGAHIHAIYSCTVLVMITTNYVMDFHVLYRRV